MVALSCHPSVQEKNAIKDRKAEDLAKTSSDSEDRIWFGKKCCRKLREKLDEAKEDIEMNTEIITTTCDALGAILANSGPQYNSSATSFPPTPSPNPVSAAIGELTGTGYGILFPI